MVRKTKLIIAGVLSVLMIVVILQNTEAVETKLLFVSISMPRALLLLITLLIGFVCGILLAGRIGRSKKKATDR